MLKVLFVTQLCFPLCPNTSALSAGVGAMTWSPLACGIISGKYGNGVPESSRAALKVFFHMLQKSGRAAAVRAGRCRGKAAPWLEAALHGRARFLWPLGWQRVGAGRGFSSCSWAPGCSWPALTASVSRAAPVSHLP